MSIQVVYAIVKAGGRQEKVSVGDVVVVDKLAGEIGDEVTLAPVMLVDGDKVTTSAADLAKSSVTAEIIGDEAAAELRDAAIKVYTAARDHAADHGIIIADTKFEFGRVDGRLILADEVLTPASSRFWPGDEYEPGKSQSSFDKQYVRDWLTAHWDKESGTKPPRLPEDVIKRTSEKYIEAYEKITGEKFPFA